MCEIFAMSSRFEENISTSLDEFSRHGGSTSDHKDGWGIANISHIGFTSLLFLFLIYETTVVQL